MAPGLRGHDAGKGFSFTSRSGATHAISAASLHRVFRHGAFMKHQLAAAMVALACMSGAAHADIVSISGDVVQTAPPATLNFNGTALSGFNTVAPIIFREYADHVVPTFSALPPSAMVWGLTPSQFVGLDYLPLDLTTTGGNIASGTSIDFYIWHYEPFGNVGQASGSVTFSGAILGIQTYAFTTFGPRELLFDRPGISLYGQLGHGASMQRGKRSHLRQRQHLGRSPYGLFSVAIIWRNRRHAHLCHAGPGPSPLHWRCSSPPCPASAWSGEAGQQSRPLP